MMTNGESLTDAIDFRAPAPACVVLEGGWVRGEGFLEFKGPGTGSLTVENHASQVFARLSTAGGGAVMGVREDGPPLDREFCGDDCSEDADRGASTTIDGDREYSIVRRRSAERHELTFEVDTAGVRIHSLRFA